MPRGGARRREVDPANGGVALYGKTDKPVSSETPKRVYKTDD